MTGRARTAFWSTISRSSTKAPRGRVFGQRFPVFPRRPPRVSSSSLVNGFALFHGGPPGGPCLVNGFAFFHGGPSPPVARFSVVHPFGSSIAPRRCTVIRFVPFGPCAPARGAERAYYSTLPPACTPRLGSVKPKKWPGGGEKGVGRWEWGVGNGEWGVGSGRWQMAIVSSFPGGAWQRGKEGSAEADLSATWGARSRPSREFAPAGGLGALGGGLGTPRRPADVRRALARGVGRSRSHARRGCASPQHFAPRTEKPQGAFLPPPGTRSVRTLRDDAERRHDAWGTTRADRGEAEPRVRAFPGGAWERGGSVGPSRSRARRGNEERRA
jgi:hypothetical protein